MQEKKPIQDLMGITMEKMREMVDVQTIIGDPIVVSEKVTIVPVSKVSYGFASGGSDLPVKSNPKDLFGGGAGAGVSSRWLSWWCRRTACVCCKWMRAAMPFPAPSALCRR